MTRIYLNVDNKKISTTSMPGCYTYKYVEINESNSTDMVWRICETQSTLPANKALTVQKLGTDYSKYSSKI